MEPLCPICKKLMPLLWTKTYYYKGDATSSENRYRCEKCEDQEESKHGSAWDNDWRSSTIPPQSDTKGRKEKLKHWANKCDLKPPGPQGPISKYDVLAMIALGGPRKHPKKEK